MNAKRIAVIGLILSIEFGENPPAQAQWAVVDVGAITQLIAQVKQLEAALQVAQSTLAQAQQAYVGAEIGAGGVYGALGSDVTATIQRNAILTPALTGNFSAAENAQLTARRGAVALQESLTRQELANVSQRFASIQTLINAIPTATDQKGILDLQARIQVEQGMLQNENSKLHVLYEAAQSQAQTERARADEQAIADIGHLRALPPMGLR